MRIEGFTVRGDQLVVHACGKQAPVQLMGARLASGAMRDDWTEELIAWLPEYRRHGMNAAVVFWQGSSGGWANPSGEVPADRAAYFEGNAASFCPQVDACGVTSYLFEPDPARRCHQSAFHVDRDYAVDEHVGRRMRRVVEGLAALDMVAVVGLFYFRPFEQMTDEARARYDFCRAARRAAEHLRDCRNVLWYPYNEFHLDGEGRWYGPQAPSEREVIAEIKAVNPDWLCGGAAPGLDVKMIDSGGYLFDEPSETPLLNVETFAAGAGGNDGFSRRCHLHGTWDEEGAAVETSMENPATKNDFYREIEGALARPGYHLFAHFQGWHQGARPGCYCRNYMGMSPGLPGGPPLRDMNAYNTASPHHGEAVLVDDDNLGRGRPGSRGVRWYYEYLRDRYSRVKHPYFENGAWDLERLVAEVGT